MLPAQCCAGMLPRLKATLPRHLSHWPCGRVGAMVFTLTSSNLYAQYWGDPIYSGTSALHANRRPMVCLHKQTLTRYRLSVGSSGCPPSRLHHVSCTNGLMARLFLTFSSLVYFAEKLHVQEDDGEMRNTIKLVSQLVLFIVEKIFNSSVGL